MQKILNFMVPKPVVQADVSASLLSLVMSSSRALLKRLAESSPPTESGDRQTEVQSSASASREALLQARLQCDEESGDRIYQIKK